MSQVVVALACLAFGCGAPHRQPGEEYLEAIRLSGNHALKSKTLVAGLALDRTRRAGRPPDPYAVQVDADRIRGQYLRQGFLDVDVRPRVERKGDAATVFYDIEEGIRASTKIQIRGLPADVPETKVRARLPLRDGGLFTYELYDAAKDPLLGVIQDAGYAHAKLETTVIADRVAHEAVVDLDYTPGPKCTFGTVTISGVTGQLAEAVRRRLRFVEGQPYSTHAIARTQRALYGFGRFSTVQIQPSEDPSPVVNVSVAVAEGARHTVELGGGFGIDPLAYEIRGRAGYSIAGWPFPLDTVTLEFRPAYAIFRDGKTYEPRIRALAKLERQDLFWTNAKGEVETGYNYLSQLAYTSYGPHVRLGFSTPLRTHRAQLQIGWGLEYLDFRTISPAIDPTLQMQLGLDRPERIGAFTQALTLDLRDQPIEPKLGWFAQARVTEGSHYAGGAFAYIEASPELRGYVPIGPVVLAGRVRTAAIYGDIPVTERLFSGGATSQRGFAERLLAPFVLDKTTEVPYGGGALLETGVEARVHLTTWRKLPVGGVVFLDGADVTERQADLDPSNLHWALGVGLRLHTIVGPVRADFGYRLNRTGPMEPSPGSRFAFHLSLGEAF